MEAGTQSALLIIWALFWMLALSVLMVHPMFRPTRIQIRRSLRLQLNRWRAARHRIQGRFRIRLGKALLWLARWLQKQTSMPLWARVPMRLLGNFVFFYLFVHLVFRQPMDWPHILTFLVISEIMDAVTRWRKRRKQRLQGDDSGNPSTLKPTQEQRAKL